MNFHQLCQVVARVEGKKESVDIAQISEVVSIALVAMAEAGSLAFGNILYTCGTDPQKQARVRAAIRDVLSD